MTKSISPARSRNARPPMTLQEAALALQARLLAARSENFAAPPVEVQSTDPVLATVTHTKLLGLLGKTIESGKTFTYRSKAKDTHYNLPVLNPNGTISSQAS